MKNQLVRLIFLLATGLPMATAFGQTTLQIDPAFVAPNPKPGFNLIFSDEFGSFDPSVWDSSDPGDDGPALDDPDMCNKTKQTPMASSNVLGAFNGSASLRTRAGGSICNFSGAEIKTFSNVPNSGYRDWKVLPNSYVEVRVKNPKCEGVGGAFWLYGGVPGRFFEIDIYELFSEDFSDFQASVHYGNRYEDIHKQHPQRYELEDLNGNSIDLGDEFLTFGVFHDNDKIQMYLNGQLYYTFNFYTPFQPWLNQFRRPVPFNIRLSTGQPSLEGNNPGSCPDLPKTMEIDYVRVFQKQNFPAAKLSPNKIELCSLLPWGDGTNVQVNYYPGVQYQWGASSNFTFTPNPTGLEDCDCMRWWTTVTPGTPTGTYFVPLTVTYPNGLQEILNLEIRVNAANLAQPNGLFLATDDSYFYFVGTPVQPNTLGYKYSVNGGPYTTVANIAGSADNILPTAFRAKSVPQQHYICVKSYNACGESQPFCLTVTIPAADQACTTCLTRLVPPGEVHTEQVGSLYRLKVSKGPLTTGYDWSFDEENWFTVANTAASNWNTLGDFDADTPPFKIYVRAKSQSTRSDHYMQQINFGGALPLQIVPNNSIDEVKPAHLRNSSGEEIESDETFTYLIFNLIGQLVRESRTQGTSLSTLYQGLPTGTYIVVALNQRTGTQSSQKVFINEQ